MSFLLSAWNLNDTTVVSGSACFLSSIRPIRYQSILSDSTSSSNQAVPTKRDISLLRKWALNYGVKFAPGIELQGKNGDFGVVLQQPSKKCTAVLTIPSKLVLSSATSSSGTKAIGFSRSTLNDYGMGEYLPEFVLVIQVLVEKSKGASSNWYAWLQSLPTEFTTGLYMDSFEKQHLQTLAPDFVKHQNQQWMAFRETCKRLRARFPKLVYPDDDSTLMWAFTVVFTRSWRNGSTEATIVPLGDMFNHDSSLPNVRVEQTSDDVAVLLTRDAGAGDGLYLNYGFTQHSARFLVIFGFCYESCRELFCNITIPGADPKELADMGFCDSSKMAIRTSDGECSNTVRHAFLYKILLQYVPVGARELYEALVKNDLRTLISLHDKWELQVARALQQHAEDVLQTTAIEIRPRDFPEHPRLPIIARYINFTRRAWQRVKLKVDSCVASAESKNKSP